MTEPSKILIVDDEPGVRDSMVLLLSEEPYELHTANGGQEAIDYLGHTRFDLMLLDLHMEPIDGSQVMKYAAENAPGTLVIIITGYASADSAIEALQLGAYYYVKKPIEAVEILRIVRNAINEKRLENERREAEEALRKSHEGLERRVQERTQDLVKANEQLRQEIEERKRTEEALKKEKEKFQVLVEESPLGISLISRDGNYQYLSPSFIKMFGYGLEDIPTGQEWFIKAFPDEKTRKHAISSWIGDLKHSKNGDSPPKVFRVTCKDGTDKITRFRPVTMKSGDHFVIYEDITEHKNLEDRFLQAQKMESLGTLAGGIAHDFNNILMGIQGRTSLMLMNLDSSHPHLNHLRGIEEHIRSAAGLTRQLLGFAKGGKFQIKPTHLNHVMGKSIEMFGRTRKDISILTDFQEDLWSVETDPGQIEQVLLNLYVNAWQAMPAGGEIFVRTKNVHFDIVKAEPRGLKPGKYVNVSVKDTGLGMDDETKRRIFEPFFTTKDMKRGTGLGLASAYGIIKNHGGLIEVRSSKGRGTTFEIFLPVTRKKVSLEKRENQDILRGTETILLIDDEAMILEVAENMLKELGYKVIPVRGGAEGLEIYRLKQKKVDMVILDMIMPEMRGAEVYRRLKGLNLEVKVLLASGYSMDEQAKDILEEGCDGFIQKPFRMKDLSKKVREVLDKK